MSEKARRRLRGITGWALALLGAATAAGSIAAVAGILAGSPGLESAGLSVAMPAGAAGIIVMLLEPTLLMLLDG